MPFGSNRGLLSIFVLAGLALSAPAFAQIYSSDNVVLLSHRDEFSGYSDIWGFVGNNGREYVILQTVTGSAWYDVQDPIHPVLLKEIPGVPSSWRDAFDIGNYVYLGTEGGGGIQIVDISNPANPTLVNTYNATVSNSHTVFGDRARKLVYVMGGQADGAGGGLQVLDASNPTNLVEVGRWTTQYVHDISAEGSIIHASLINIGRFRLISTSTPSNPVSLGTVFADPVGACHSSWPFGDGIHVLMTEETGGGHVKCLDVSNPNAISMVDDYNPAPSSIAHNPHIQGNMAAVSWYTRGTRLLNITDPANLTEIGYLDTYPPNDGGNYSGNWGTFPNFPSGLVASSDITGGLFLFKYEPNAATLDGTVSSSLGGTLAGATVEYTNLGLSQVTAANGYYKFACYPGAGNKIRFSSFGFQSDSINVAVAANGTTTTNVTLTKLPSGAIQGTVRDAATALPIELVEISLVGTPLKTTTNASGVYSFLDVPSGSYQLQVLRYGYLIPGNIPVTITTGNTLTRDLNLHAAPFYEDFATPAGWTVNNDGSLTSGAWVFGEPWGTYASGQPFQPEFDHTLNPETICAVTGNASVGDIGGDDVDGGATRLLSPVFNLSTMSEPHVFYYRWYAVNDQIDEWVVQVTGNGGANWVELESSPLHDPQWLARDFNLTGLLGSYNAVQFRFIAQDPSPGQVVEAALDDFTIYDANGIGAVGVPGSVPPRFPLELSQNFPNPFATVTGIHYSIPEKSHVELSVFDVRGARVAVLEDGIMDAGPHEVVWDGKDFTGKKVASGVFFYKLAAADTIHTKKMIRLD